MERGREGQGGREADTLLKILHQPNTIQSRYLATLQITYKVSCSCIYHSITIYEYTVNSVIYAGKIFMLIHNFEPNFIFAK